VFAMIKAAFLLLSLLFEVRNIKGETCIIGELDNSSED